jgi:hypothetical protein
MSSNKGLQSRFRPLADVMEEGSTEFRRLATQFPSDLSVWTKLYTANQTMLSAMGQQRVISALVEICSNLLGCEELAIVEVDHNTERVQLLASEGLASHQVDIIAQAARQLQSRIDPGSPHITSDEDGKADSRLGKLGISAVIPLWKDPGSSGALVLFQLLPQRSGFDEEDRKILQLLSIYAGPCLRSQSRG